MINPTLKAFYYGNLTPASRQIVKDSEFALVTEKVSKAEDLLEQALAPESRPILESLMDAQMTLNGIIAETRYIEGFKTGARFMMEILDDAWENLEPITG